MVPEALLGAKKTTASNTGRSHLRLGATRLSGHAQGGLKAVVEAVGEQQSYWCIAAARRQPLRAGGGVMPANAIATQSRVSVQAWQRVSRVPVRMWQRVSTVPASTWHPDVEAGESPGADVAQSRCRCGSG